MLNRALSLSAVAAAAALAQAQLSITEAYIGLDGPDGTADWIEITNFGASAVNLGGLFYDDNSADISAGGNLPNFNLAAGRSVVVLIETGVDSAPELAAFNAVWGGGIDVIAVAGGGSLGQGGDAAVLLNADSDILSFFSYGGIPGTTNATLERISGINPVISTLGVNGARLSNAFTNVNFPGGTVQIIGSPGAIPAPAAATIIALGGLAAGRRRR